MCCCKELIENVKQDDKNNNNKNNNNNNINIRMNFLPLTEENRTDSPGYVKDSQQIDAEKCY